MQYVLAIYIHFIIILCFRECLGPILGGAIVYKVGFRSMTAVSLADNVLLHRVVWAHTVLSREHAADVGYLCTFISLCIAW